MYEFQRCIRDAVQSKERSASFSWDPTRARSAFDGPSRASIYARRNRPFACTVTPKSNERCIIQPKGYRRRSKIQTSPHLATKLPHNPLHSPSTTIPHPPLLHLPHPQPYPLPLRQALPHKPILHALRHHRNIPPSPSAPTPFPVRTRGAQIEDGEGRAAVVAHAREGERVAVRGGEIHALVPEAEAREGRVPVELPEARRPVWVVSGGGGVGVPGRGGGGGCVRAGAARG